MMRHNGPAGNLAPDPVLSNAFTSWGQYIVHDILQTPDAFTNVNDEDKPFDECKCDASRVTTEKLKKSVKMAEILHRGPLEAHNRIPEKNNRRKINAYAKSIF